MKTLHVILLVLALITAKAEAEVTNSSNSSSMNSSADILTLTPEYAAVREAGAGSDLRLSPLK
ncbi:MAG: hypothetical protein EBR40_09770 [Proteobacteria bacterium]|nr:hypothetical protein [Pseudomonadota bacterium]